MSGETDLQEIKNRLDGIEKSITGNGRPGLREVDEAHHQRLTNLEDKMGELYDSIKELSRLLMASLIVIVGCAVVVTIF